MKSILEMEEEDISGSSSSNSSSSNSSNGESQDSDHIKNIDTFMKSRKNRKDFKSKADKPPMIDPHLAEVLELSYKQRAEEEKTRAHNKLTSVALQSKLK